MGEPTISGSVEDLNSSQPSEAINRQDLRTLENKGRRQVEKVANRLEVLVVEQVEIDTVFPNPYNPNRQSEKEFDMLKKSILDDGFTQPIVVQRSTRMIVDGEHRWRAMNHLGFKKIDVVFVDMTDQQMRIATLRHNRARGSEDAELSIQILKDLRQLGALDQAVRGLNIDDAELQAMLEDLPAPAALSDEEYAQAWIPKTTRVATEPEIELDDRRISTTDSAQTTLMAYENMMDEARTHLERNVINQAAHFEINQVSVTFTKEDAALARAALGERPAQQLLQICVAYVLANKGEFEEHFQQSADNIYARIKSGKFIARALAASETPSENNGSEDNGSKDNNSGRTPGEDSSSEGEQNNGAE